MPANRKVSPRQLEILIAFAEENQDIALGRCSRGPQAHQVATEMWNRVATKINSVADGVTKTGDQWRRYWIELKAKTKAKAADNRRSAVKTGGGPNKLLPLTPIEERILQIVGRVAVEGLPGVQIPFEDPTPSSSTQPPIPKLQSPQPAPSVAYSPLTDTPIPGSSMPEDPCMEVEWLEEDLFNPQPSSCEVLSNPPDPSLSIPIIQTPPPVHVPPTHDIPAASASHSKSPPPPPPPPPPQRQRRQHRLVLRDLPRWAQQAEERRLAHEERMAEYMLRMVAVMENIDRRLESMNQNLFNINSNLQR